MYKTKRLSTLLCIVLRTKIHKKVDNLFVFKKFFQKSLFCVEFIKLIERYFFNVEFYNTFKLFCKFAVNGTLYE